jgi:hypothetical protein
MRTLIRLRHLHAIHNYDYSCALFIELPVRLVYSDWDQDMARDCCKFLKMCCAWSESVRGKCKEIVGISSDVLITIPRDLAAWAVAQCCLIYCLIKCGQLGYSKEPLRQPTLRRVRS